MKINIRYIYNKQAVDVEGGDWKITYRNQRLFDYWNHVLNGGEVRQWSDEQIEGSKGNY